MTLKLICSGAIYPLVDALTPALSALSESGFSGSFGAVQTLYERVRRGEACDVVVLSSPMVEHLCAEGFLLPDTVRLVGTLVLAVAVPKGQPLVDVSTVSALKCALAGAEAIYVPDMARTIPGFHVRRVIGELGLDDRLKSRIKQVLGGRTAMAALAQSRLPRSIGCNLLPNMLATPGVDVCGFFPEAYTGRVIYAAAVSSNSKDPETARAVVDCLTAPHNEAVRVHAGICSASGEEREG